MRINLVRLISLICSIITCCYCSPLWSATPSQVVDKYCKLDLDGTRLSSKSINKIKVLMIDGTNNYEPGWDTFKVISGYKILKKTSNNKKSATVTVEYKILATIDSTPDIQRKEQQEIIDFILIRDNQTWKIKDYIAYPRISINTAEKILNELKQETQDKDRLNKINSIINEFNKLKCQ